jgi:hypothetical protein
MSGKGIYRVLIFLVALVLCDAVFGWVAQTLFYSQKSGKYARLTYIVKSDTSAIIVLGSSHANRQFVSQQIEDSLHESTFNYGTQGQKLLFNRAIYEIRKSRAKPKMVLLNVDPDWFIDKHNQQDRMSDLYPYYGSEGGAIFRDFSQKDRFLAQVKFLSKTFPYNSTIVHVIRYKMKSQEDVKGYAPLYGVVDSVLLQTQLDAEKVASRPKALPAGYDSTLVNLFGQFVEEITRDHIRLFVIVTPTLLRPEYWEVQLNEKTREICRGKNVPMIDFSGSDFFMHNRQLFEDLAHLNDSGSRIFTKMVIDSMQLK